MLLDRYHLVALDPSVYLVTHVPFRVEPLDLLAVAFGMLLVSFFATVIPARAAARLDPVVALRSA
jgi:lipoprotein-releasing system permease protein